MPASTIVNYAFYGFVGVYVIFGALLGIIRGFRRQFVRLLTIIGSAVGAFFLSNYAYDAVVNWITSVGAEGVLNTTGVAVDEATRNIIISLDTEFLVYAVSIPFLLVIAPVLFVILYGAIATISLIIHKLICGALGFSRRNNNPITRFGGMILGAVQGLLIAVITLVPVCGIINTAHIAVVDAERNRPGNDYTLYLSGAYDTYFRELDENPLYLPVSTAAVYVYDTYMNTELYGEEIHMKDVASTVVDIYVATADLNGADFAALRDQDKAVIDDIITHATENRYLSVIMADIFKTFSHLFENGVLDISIASNEKVTKLMNDIIYILGTSNRETVTEDVTTVKNIYYLLSDGGVLAVAKEENPDLFALFTKADENGKTLMSRMNAELVKNPRMVVLCTDIAEVAMVLVLQNSGMSDTIAPETIENVKGTLNDVVKIDKDSFETEEEYKAAVSESIGATLTESNIALEPEQLSAVTDFVVQELSGKEEITDEDMANFMSEYYDAYVSGTLEIPDGVEIPDDFEIPGVTDPDGNDSENQGGTQLPEGVEIPDDFELPEGVEIPGGSPNP